MSSHAQVDAATHTEPASPPPLSRLSVVSAVLGIAAVALLLTFGAPALATFAVGAGHVALYRSRRDHLRGRTLALIGLGLGYLVPVVAIVEILAWGASLQR